MKKAKLSTWKAIQKKYPDEWVLLIEPVADKNCRVKKGILVAHGKDKEAVRKNLKNVEWTGSACLFTGDLNKAAPYPFFL